MTSSKGKARARELARAKYERQLARRAASVRRGRQIKAGVGVLIVLLVGVGVAWFMGVFDGHDKSTPKSDHSTSASHSSSPSPSSSASKSSSSSPSGKESSSSKK
ncbi:MAG TPA: hypothetical protein VE172_23415 [Stackebrandtia sp.]|uniref:hypothetical protein n=1 Tax=Stackebrandtia sp. TaxID=2023065 RepID=UPI002D3127C9|nr:hypothetical protein [Stackebrandtia sp.]HZE41759.1 hypothetical protein [Stackebrandtia sp.]